MKDKCVREVSMLCFNIAAVNLAIWWDMVGFWDEINNTMMIPTKLFDCRQ
jgi:hypothetical protein